MASFTGSTGNTFSADDVLDVCLHVELGLELASALVLNGAIPLLHAYTALLTLSLLVLPEGTDAHTARCVSFMLELADMAPGTARSLRAMLLEREAHPGLILELTFGLCADEILFFNR
jgi:hypothetical protein